MIPEKCASMVKFLQDKNDRAASHECRAQKKTLFGDV